MCDLSNTRPTRGRRKKKTRPAKQSLSFVENPYDGPSWYAEPSVLSANNPVEFPCRPIDECDVTGWVSPQISNEMHVRQTRSRLRATQARSQMASSQQRSSEPKLSKLSESKLTRRRLARAIPHDSIHESDENTDPESVHCSKRKLRSRPVTLRQAEISCSDVEHDSICEFEQQEHPDGIAARYSDQRISNGSCGGFVNISSDSMEPLVAGNISTPEPSLADVATPDMPMRRHHWLFSGRPPERLDYTILAENTPLQC